MTILTKGMGEKKPAKQADVPDDTKGIMEPVVLPSKDVEAGATETAQDDFLYMTPRERTVSTLCLFLVAVLITALGVAVGIHMYQQYAQQTVQFSGMFSIPYENGGQPDYFQSSQGMSDDDDDDVLFDRLSRNSRLFHEKVETDSEDRMRIFVPNFKDGRKGRFVHDFSVNKTAIVDQLGGTCFIMPLDTTRIVRPKNLVELIRKIWEGSYSVNTTVVRETMRAKPFPMNEYLSPYLAEQCEGKTLYKLFKVDNSGLVKRSIADPEKREAFYSYGGKSLTMWEIELPESLH